ncbi:MAG: stalk domain-containing protein, partial [Caldisericia bacterium]|nr:stalk domain-containing protein [Caldisericia bacterium]
DIEINPRNENEVFIATDETGLYSSKNGGEEWFFSGKGIDNKHITSVMYHPLDPNVLFCTTIGSGVFCSKDNGNSWKSCNEGLGSLVVYCIEMNGVDQEEILVGTETGIYRKKDMDENWELFGDGIEGLRVRSILKNPATESYFAGTDQKGLYRNIHIPNVPIPMSPKNNERIITLRPTLLWTETTDVTIPYTFSLKITNSNQEIVFQKDHISGDQFIIPADVLTRYETYFWTVRAESFAGDTQWSKPYSFTIIGQIVLKINEPLMTVNGKIVEVDPGRTTTPIIVENRTFLPIRSVVESFEGSVEWDSSTRSIVLLFKENKIELQLKNPIAKRNGKNVQIDPDNQNIAPFIENERTMIPLRFVAENLDIEINWNAEEREITLEYPKK